MYAGGLGVLAGDHIKSASDLAIPAAAVSLFYREGYFRQHVDPAGRQWEDNPVLKPEELPLELLPSQAPVVTTPGAMILMISGRSCAASSLGATTQAATRATPV